jgi:hypothetical protein
MLSVTRIATWYEQVFCVLEMMYPEQLIDSSQNGGFGYQVEEKI